MNEVAVARITPNEMPVKDLGQILTRSGYFRDAKDYSQAVVKVLAGRELGLPPIASMMGIYFVQGKISFSAQTMAALIRRSGRYSYTVLRLDEQACEVEITEGGKGIGKSKFTMEDAKAAGLAQGDNWKKYPRNMLFARALSNAARWFCPDVFGGAAYTPDELGAIVDGETGEVDKPEAPVVVEVELEKPESPAQPAETATPSPSVASEAPAGDVSPAGQVHLTPSEKIMVRIEEHLNGGKLTKAALTSYLHKNFCDKAHKEPVCDDVRKLDLLQLQAVSAWLAMA